MIITKEMVKTLNKQNLANCRILADKVCKHYELEPVIISYNHRFKERQDGFAKYGRYKSPHFENGTLVCTIELMQDTFNPTSTLLHELAHHLRQAKYRCPEFTHHDKKFCKCLEQITKDFDSQRA